MRRIAIETCPCLHVHLLWRDVDQSNPDLMVASTLQQTSPHLNTPAVLLVQSHWAHSRLAVTSLEG